MTIIIYITSRNRFLWDSCPRYHLSPAIPRLHRHSTGRLSDLGNPLALTQKGATCAGRLECCSWPFVDTFSSANCFWGMFTRMQGWVWCIPLKKKRPELMKATEHEAWLVVFPSWDVWDVPLNLLPEPLAALLLYWIMDRTSNNQAPSTVHIGEIHQQ